MRLFAPPGQHRRPAATRTRLSVLALDDRAAPSSLAAPATNPLDQAALDKAATLVAMTEDPGGPGTGTGHSPGADNPPQITNFQVERVGPGMYKFTGLVIDESPGGLTVTLTGIPSLEAGVAVVTRSDGTFEATLQLRTDGSDIGVVSAVTRDWFGQLSNTATVYVNPY
jgi:hypothetical protein